MLRTQRRGWALVAGAAGAGAALVAALAGPALAAGSPIVSATAPAHRSITFGESPIVAAPIGRDPWGSGPSQTDGAPTKYPIKHLVVIFDENVSFDHYFGTYPTAANPPGEPAFQALTGTPTVNGLSNTLLSANPNLSNPQRLDRSQALTCDQDHGYTSEQKAFDHGLMDQFVQDTGHGLTLAQCLGAQATTGPANYAVMDYYDGNTVTGLWEYAQHFALSDNSYGTNFGPSTPGALNVTSAQTYGALCGPSWAVYNSTPCTGAAPTQSEATPGAPVAAGPGTDYSDADPLYDVCSNGAMTGGTYDPSKDIAMGGPNIGTALDSAGVTWGWFQGGFAAPGYVPGQPATDDLSKVCTSTHQNIGGATIDDYIPHHEPFQYYAATANPEHLPPTSVAMIGHQDQANHQYDLSDFWAAADSGNMPAVSFLKAAGYQDGHAGYSDPLDEQTFLATTINHLESLPSWRSTAVVINWDDSDGWYDHQMGPIVAQSQTSLDALTGNGTCGFSAAEVPGAASNPEQARCGVGPRLPLLVISPYAKSNFVDNTFSTQSSIVGFIEENWLGGKSLGNAAADTEGTIDNMFDFSHPGAGRLFLDPSTGEVVGGQRMPDGR
ncbi:MAG TPA: alkaline phosphatase family protein [Acidimicrobiales bacterium]|nr:alkaline phosphatase family protein [Acidimicrobiales bacterium]